MRAIQRRYPNDVVLVFRHLPLTSIHEQALGAARASECASLQGRFDEMADVLYSHQDSLGRLPWRSLAVNALVNDLGAFDQCITSSASVRAVARDSVAAARLGATGTPTVLVNGLRFLGAPSLEVLDSLVRRALIGDR